METVIKKTKPTYTSSRNACKMCAPLGASLVFKGIEGCIPMIHGSQGCATYIRRYMISHYKEPVDIASSNFNEESTIYGGAKNFIQGIDNVIKQYKPKVIGIASTCLSETIGEDIPGLIYAYNSENKDNEDLPLFIHASTPSYQGTHMDGFHETVFSTVATLATKSETKGKHINLFSGFISPADIRHLKDIMDAFETDYVLFPDFSETLDNPFWKDYHLIPEGGTKVEDIRRTASALASIEIGTVLNKGALQGRIRNAKNISTAGEWLEKNHDVPNHRILMPIGIDATDNFLNLISQITNKPIPERYVKERGRLVDAYIDGHKYVFGKRAIVVGDEDLILGIASFLEEIGIEIVLLASGGESGLLLEEYKKINNKQTDNYPMIVNGMDFESINDITDELKPDIIIGSSKAYYISRRLGIPLVRLGFPIHDRVGGPRIQHLAYQGTISLFDTIVNALLDFKQEHSPIGYKYM
jgi:nitrogenase molybdenum-iron protein NifN